jgi:hypothetical protein
VRPSAQLRLLAYSYRRRVRPESRRALRLEGMLSNEETLALYTLAQAVRRPDCIVEVGSYRGRSTAALAAGARPSGVAVYAIEPHEPFTGILGGQFGPEDRKQFFRNMLRSRSTDEVRLVNLSSEIVAQGWQKPVGLLWLDGDHSYAGVRRDFEAWEPHLSDAVTVALHDSNQPSIQRFLGELTAIGWEAVKRVDLITVIKRR